MISQKSSGPMAWAIDSQTDQLVYIGALGVDRSGGACRCICIGCRGALQAVNVDKPPEHFMMPGTMRPFFRHDDGEVTAHQASSCMRKAAWAAALKLFVERDVLDLPAPRARRTLMGVRGGTFYAEAYGSPMRVRIRDRTWIDRQRAALVLDTGELIEVVVSASNTIALDEEMEQGRPKAAYRLSITVDDPSASSWSPETLMERITALGADCWLAHPDLDGLDEKAAVDAIAQAREALEWPEEGLELPDGLSVSERQESLLHAVVKEMLAKSGYLVVPPGEELVSARSEEGNLFERWARVPGGKLDIRNARLERKLGSIVPDIIVTAVPRSQAWGASSKGFELLVEVAVTHRVDQAKLRKIQELGMSCIEIDLTRIGLTGRVHKDALRKCVMDHEEGKQWLVHREALRRAEGLQGEVRLAADEFDARAKRERAAARRRADKVASMSEEELAAAWLKQLQGIWYGRTVGLNDSELVPWEMLREALMGKVGSVIADPQLTRKGGLLQMLRQIRLAHELDPADKEPTGRGYSWVEEAFSTADAWYASDRRYLGMLLICLKAYPSHLSLEAAELVQQVREKVTKSVAAGERTFARPPRLDGIVKLLFPKMAVGLGMEMGTEAFAAKISAEKEAAASAAEMAEEERRKAEEAEKEAEAQRQAQERRRLAAEQAAAEEEARRVARQELAAKHLGSFEWNYDRTYEAALAGAYAADPVGTPKPVAQALLEGALCAVKDRVSILEWSETWLKANEGPNMASNFLKLIRVLRGAGLLRTSS
jgi:hypothetical protein